MNEENQRNENFSAPIGFLLLKEQNKPVQICCFQEKIFIKFRAASILNQHQL
jgi:hypothetical protein